MCDCIQKADDVLKDKGVCIDTTCFIRGEVITEKPRIQLVPIEGRRKRDMPSTLSYAFCPMCGEAYNKPEATPEPQSNGAAA